MKTHKITDAKHLKIIRETAEVRDDFEAKKATMQQNLNEMLAQMERAAKHKSHQLSMHLFGSLGISKESILSLDTRYLEHDIAFAQGFHPAECNCGEEDGLHALF